MTIIAPIIFLSCNDKEVKEIPKTKLARVENSYLYFEDLEEKLPHFENETDSVEFLNFYIQNWIKNQVIASKSKEALLDKSAYLDEKVENYRQSLSIHLFEQEFIKQRLDTIVSDNEVETYYKENTKNFELSDFILKPLYFKLPKESKLNKKANSWYKLYDYDNDLDNLYKKISFKSEIFHYDTTQWVFMNDVKSIIPISYSNSADFLRSKKHYKVTEGDFTYYLNIIDYKLKKSVSPLDLVKDRIKSIILNQRREKIREQLRFDLYDNAKKTGKIETYNH